MKFTTLSFVEFLEMLARCADCTHIPTSADIEEVGADGVMDYEVKLKEVDPDMFSRLTTRRPSAQMMAPKVSHPDVCEYSEY